MASRMLARVGGSFVSSSSTCAPAAPQRARARPQPRAQADSQTAREGAHPLFAREAQRVQRVQRVGHVVAAALELAGVLRAAPTQRTQPGSQAKPRKKTEHKKEEGSRADLSLVVDADSQHLADFALAAEVALRAGTCLLHTQRRVRVKARNSVRISRDELS